MTKFKNWIKAHLPSKRKLIQVYAMLLFNANLKGFATGEIYKGSLKNMCTPGLNCYSCPGASGACPLGALQNSLASSGKTVPYYVFGIIMLYGLLFGRWICGFLCPFGLIQELLHKIPTPKLKKNKFTRILSYLKYVILAFFVFIIPIAYMFRNFPLPGFCKYICPAGTLEGAMGLLSNKANEGYLRMLGPLFTWKFLLMVSFLVGCVFVFRLFCRFICPLGALYGLFNKISFVGVKVDEKSCTDCGICIGKCKMDVKKVGDQECIFCGECIEACPTKAISWKGSKFVMSTGLSEIDDGISEEEKEAAKVEREERNRKIAKRNGIVKTVTAILMVVVLAAALVYYNFIDGRPDESANNDINSGENIDNGSNNEGNNGSENNGNNGGSNEGNNETPQPPVGTNVGNTCPTVAPTILATGEKFDLGAQEGKVTVLNFWYTTCGPCVEELPHFYETAKAYGDKLTVVAIHVEQKKVDPVDWIANNSGHPEWNDGTMLIAWDDGKACQKLFSIQACPVTIVIDENRVISDIFIGSVTHDELIAAVEKAMK